MSSERLQKSSGSNGMITVAVVSLGCAKNQVDAEQMLGSLYRSGYSITNDAGEADVIVVNSCGFIKAARTETIETVHEMNRYREEGKLKTLILAGCMAGDDRNLFLSECRIDAVLPPFRPDALAELIRNGRIRHRRDAGRLPPLILPAEERILTTSGAHAYVKIADGCRNRCAYCRIPGLRGPFRSKAADDVILEIESLLAEGVMEINIVSQDCTLYGSDTDGNEDLPGLIRRIDTLAGDFRFRLLYLHPDRVDERLMISMAKCTKICRYIDMPLQHVSRRILARMNRSGDPDSIRKKLKMVRRYVPNIAIRTTLMTGYPGETEGDFEEMIRLVGEGWFNHLGVFSFSPEPDTPAAALRQSVDVRLAEDRRAELAELQGEIAEECFSWLEGRVVPLVVDLPEPDFPGYTVARTEFQAPEVDSVVLVPGMHDPEEGFIRARIISASGPEWTAEIP